ncbi:transposable element P transposase [Rhipicephalus sanguineus]|uniref:transposable element P transposase n=1 Tax=Rhipicephalus sanguineus TaxID=34632 RepID=UPI0020C50F1A|nr:transposable element P transposase [Rhipicephalus sanguineus]
MWADHGGSAMIRERPNDHGGSVKRRSSPSSSGYLDKLHSTTSLVSQGYLSPDAVTALHERIRELENKLQRTQRSLALTQQQKKKVLQEKSNLQKQINHFLAPDQLQSLERSSNGKQRWSPSTIQKALKVRLSCGARGYAVVKELCTPLPAERTLQRHLEKNKFSPCVLHNILHCLSLKVKVMDDHERHAVLMFDEIQLTTGLALDQSTGVVIGRPTIQLADGTLPEDTLATHGLVFMLGGVTTRWKQTVAYHFTGNSFSSSAVKNVILDIIEKCEKISIYVDAVVSDMAGGNQALWKEFGIIVGKHCKASVSCPHPSDASRRLYFIADVAHLLKNLRNHFTRRQSFFLPDDIVTKLKLPPNEAKIEHVKALVQIDAKLDLNLAPHLKPACLEPGHFEKMKQGGSSGDSESGDPKTAGK